MTGHTVRVLQDALGFGVSGSTGFLTPNLEIWTISSSFASPIDQIDLYPVKRLILRAQIEHQSCKPIVLKAAIWPVGGCCAGPLRSKMAWVSPALEEGFSDILLGALTGAASAVYA